MPRELAHRAARPDVLWGRDPTSGPADAISGSSRPAPPPLLRDGGLASGLGVRRCREVARFTAGRGASAEPLLGERFERARRGGEVDAWRRGGRGVWPAFRRRGAQRGSGGGGGVQGRPGGLRRRPRSSERARAGRRPRGQDEPEPQGAVEPAEHHLGGGGRRQHVRGPVHRLPPLLQQGRPLPPGLGAGAAAAAARPAAQRGAAAHGALPALGDVPHRAARRQPLRRQLRAPAQPRAARPRRPGARPASALRCAAAAGGGRGCGVALAAGRAL